VIVLALAALLAEPLAAQTSPAERRAFREYTSPQELVSIAPTTPLDKALAAISEVSQKFVGKIIVDTERRAMPINIDVQGVQWRDALEMILRKNDLWYTEYENYLQVTTQAGTEGRAQTAGPAGAVTTDILKEPASFRSREIKISGIFFEVNLSRIEEVGLNWNFMKSTNDVLIDSKFSGADRVSDEMFKTEITPKVSFASMSFVAQLFSDYKLGEILSSPTVIVRSGEEGRIQVGQDFSVRERDFAGNLIDRFYSAGTIVKVKPQVITEQGVNFVHLNIEAERSSVTPGAVSTIINKTKATTNVLLLDGEETIIGGLYNTESSTTRQGVPFLKDLPWWVFGLRFLFGYEKEENVKKELVILLKADLVPTLQERVTQRVSRATQYERWQDEKAKVERSLTGK
jgi:type IV pilus assembly protein PilQ